MRDSTREKWMRRVAWVGGVLVTALRLAEAVSLLVFGRLF